MTTDPAFLRPSSGTVGLALRPLPDRVAALLSVLGGPPRPAAHLRAVHDVAHRLVDWVEERCPAVAIDRDAALFEAATHDMGTAVPGTGHHLPVGAASSCGRRGADTVAAEVAGSG
ncbi:hypothetical protein [Streptomyces sp. NBC_00704]|uniref:hypothetical protein n=1 Tax=Streptomyces sp. NBC_00704 TaxID=2975809 RepID=UPI003FA72DBC